MANTPRVSYKRAPSKELQCLLMPGGDLSWLVDLGKKEVAGYHHDVHFRGKEIHVYRDGARLIKAKWLSRSGKVELLADDRYISEACTRGFFGRHNVADTMSKEFHEALKKYLGNVNIASNQKGKEGAIQIQWSQAGTCPWTPFDREAVLKGPHCTATEFPRVVLALIAIQAEGWKSGWDELKQSTKSTSGGIDQLAIDQHGRMVLLELKDGTNNDSKVYYSPFQLLQYVWEWHNALKEVPSLWEDLCALIDARKKVGLTPKHVPELNGGIRAAVGFGNNVPTAKTKEHYKKVLEIANEHLPSDVLPIETWAWSDNGPYPLSW